MYEKCLECNKLGNPCDGPNFMAMSTDDLIHWCNERKKQLPGLTYDRLLEKTGLSKGTISGFFKGTHADYRIETIRPILKILVGGEWEDSPCGDPTAEERNLYEEKIRQLERDLEHEISWRDDKIQHLENNYAAMQQLITNTNQRATTDKDFLRSQIRNRNKTVAVLSICLGLCLILIITALIIDSINPDVGFFWLQGLLPFGANGTEHTTTGIISCIKEGINCVLSTRIRA